MLILQVPYDHLQHMRHKPMWAFLFILIIVVLFLDKTFANVETEPPQTTTPEPGELLIISFHFIHTY